MSFVKRQRERRKRGINANPLAKGEHVPGDAMERAALLMEFGSGWPHEYWKRHPELFMSAAEYLWQQRKAQRDD